MPGIAGLAIALVLALGAVRSRDASVDGPAVERALAIRSGRDTAAWTIDIEGRGERRVHVTMRHRNGRIVRRDYVLEATTAEERSRELAAGIALALEQEAPAGEGADGPSVAAPIGGWVAAGLRLGAGRPDADGGVSLRAGMLWGRRHVQPIVHLGSVHARAAALRVDGVRVGLGLAGGAPWRQWWFGAAVIPQLAHMVARGGPRTARSLASSTEITALAQWRSPVGVLVAARLGTDIQAPSLRAVGRRDSVRLAPVRLLVGVEVGLVLPLSRKR